MNYRADIDGLRAIAIVSVLLFHLDLAFFAGGFVGVDIFFVISGFLITSLLRNELLTTGRIDLGSFYTRRFRRLLPALLVTLMATTCAAVLLLSPIYLERFGGALASAVLGLSNHYFWAEADYFDLSAKIKPLLHTWSLSIEEQFYLIWPITLSALFNSRLRRLIPYCLLLAAFISLSLNLIFGSGGGGLGINENNFINSFFFI